VSDEDRMRHALGLDNASASARVSSGPSQVHRPRRFVKDGEIPVVLMNTGGDRSAQTSTMAKRLADAEAVIWNEQAARATAERALADALATIQRLRTQLAHAEMSHAETLEAERKHRETLEQALLETANTRESLEKQLAHQANTPPQRIDAKATTTAETVCERHGQKGKRTDAAREPVPVKWWLPSHKAKFGKRAAKSRR